MKSHNIPLIVGMALPVVFIVVIAAVLLLPSLLVKPQHNFIYTEDAGYYSYQNQYKNTYELKDGKLNLVALPQNPDVKNSGYNALVMKDAPTLYVYDVKNDSAREVSYSEAMSFSLDAGPSSPDGYTVGYGYGHNGIFELFGSNGSNNGYFISKGSGKKKLHALMSGRSWSPGEFRLLGWVK